MLCLNLFRINMIRIDTILNMSRLEIKTWRNTLKFEQIAQRMFGDKVIPWIAASKSSNQKLREKVQLILQLLHSYTFIPTSTVIREMRVLRFWSLKNSDVICFHGQILVRKADHTHWNSSKLWKLDGFSYGIKIGIVFSASVQRQQHGPFGVFWYFFNHFCPISIDKK